MADALLQTLTIKLNAEVGNTKRKLNDVATSVEKLEEIGKKADWSIFEQIRTNLEGIANIDFSKVADSLKDVVTAMKALGVSAKQVKNMPAMTSPRMEDTAVGEMSEPSWQLNGLKMIANVFSAGTKYLQEFNAKLAEAKKGVYDIQDAFDPWRRSLASCYLELNQIEFLVNQIKTIGAPVADFDALKQRLLEAGFSLNKVNELLSQIGKSNGFGNWEESLRQCGLTANEVSIVIKDLFETQREPIDFQKLRDVLISLGFSAEQAEFTMTKLGKEVEKTGDKAKNSIGKWEKLIKSIKRITFYRMVRRAIQLIGQAITQGVQNMALFDSDFNNSMSNIMSSLNYFKNSLGTLLTPVIQALEPFITMLMDGLADVNNLIGEIFAKMQGKDQFSKAIKGADNYAESLKKIKSVSLGIDELNVIQKDEQANKFETVDIEPDKTAESFKKVGANILETFKKIGENIKKILNAVLQPLLSLLEPIMEIVDFVLYTVSEIFDLVVALVEPFIAPLVNFIRNILTFVSGILNAIKPIITGISQALNPVLSTAGTWVKFIFDTLNSFAPVLTVIVSLVKVLIVPITTVLAIFTTIFEVLKGIAKTFIQLFTFDFKNIKKTWEDVGNNIKNAWQNVADSAKSIGDVEITAYATGGFPEDGFFYANHNELVGQFSNGRTAVANNEQITEGIYQAVRSALQDGGNNAEVNRDIIIQIDGREIGRASEKYQRQLGAKIFSGGSGYGN